MAVARVGLALVFIVALLLPATAGILAGAEQPLAADIQHGIVVWDTTAALYKRGAGPHQRCISISVGSDDVRRILSWSTDTVYITVYVKDIDLWASTVPQLQASILYPQPSLGNIMYQSQWVSIPHPGVYEIPIPMDAIRRASQLYGSIAIQLCVPDWNTNTATGAPDSFFKVVLDKVIVAPPQGAVVNKPAGTSTPMAAGLPSGAVSIAVAAGAGLALGILAVVMVHRRR